MLLKIHFDIFQKVMRSHFSPSVLMLDLNSPQNFNLRENSIFSSLQSPIKTVQFWDTVHGKYVVQSIVTIAPSGNNSWENTQS